MTTNCAVLRLKRKFQYRQKKKLNATERDGLNSTIARLKAEIIAAEDKIKTLDSKLEDKKKIIEAEYQTKLSKLDSDTQIANEWSDKEVEDITELTTEIITAEEMIKHLNEYYRMTTKTGGNSKACS